MDPHDLPSERPPGPTDARERLHDLEELTALYKFPAFEWFNERNIYGCRTSTEEEDLGRTTHRRWGDPGWEEHFRISRRSSPRRLHRLLD